MKRIGIVGRDLGFLTRRRQVVRLEVGVPLHARARKRRQQAWRQGYDTPEEMIADPTADHRHLRPHLHEEPEKVLNAGKALLLKNPSPATAERALVRKGRARAAPFMVTQSLRFMPAYIAIKKVDEAACSTRRRRPAGAGAQLGTAGTGTPKERRAVQPDAHDTTFFARPRFVRVRRASRTGGAGMRTSSARSISLPASRS